MKTDFKTLLNKLSDNNFEFILIGGFAASVYGSSYVTHYLDICAVLTPGNIEKLRNILSDLHPKHRITVNKPSFLEIPEELEGINNLYLETDAGVLDFISNVIGVGDFLELSKNAIEIKIFGRICKIISLDDLIKTKTTLKRPKDILVAEELEIIRKRNKK